MTFREALDSAQRAELEALRIPAQYEDGALLFAQGDPSTGGHLVRSGAVDLTLTLPGGEERHVARIGPGGFFGEPALLSAGRRQHSARAVGPTRVDALDRFDFQGLRHGLRPVSFTVLLELARLIGRRLLRAGQASASCFVVVRGAVEAVNPATNERVALFGPGNVFGQLAPLLGTPVIADCRMREVGVVLELGPDALDVLLKPHSRLSFRFVNAIGRALLGGLARANRVWARAGTERRA
ncbi:MAG: CRP-like cAMP-binding protein [Myxococcota bacterium]